MGYNNIELFFGDCLIFKHAHMAYNYLSHVLLLEREERKCNICRCLAFVQCIESFLEFLTVAQYPYKNRDQDLEDRTDVKQLQ